MNASIDKPDDDDSTSTRTGGDHHGGAHLVRVDGRRHRLDHRAAASARCGRDRLHPRPDRNLRPTGP